MSSSDSRGTLLFAPLAGVLLSVSAVSGPVLQQFGNVSSAGGVSPAWIQIGVTAFSVVVTGGLVYLYNEQRKLNALEYTADVRPEGHRPSEEGGLLDVCLSNRGRGVATDLSLRIDTSFPDADEVSGFPVEKTPIKRLGQPNAEGVHNEWARPARNYVGPERYFVRFWTPIPVRWRADDDAEDARDGADTPNRTVLANLADELPNSVDRVRLTVTLEYRDQLDDERSELIVDDVLPLEPGEDLDYLFSRGMTNDQYERRNASDECEDPFETLTVHRPQLVGERRTEKSDEEETR